MVSTSYGRPAPSRRARAADILLVAALLVLGVVGPLGVVERSAPRPWALGLLGAVAAVSLAWRRRWPVPVWAVSGAAAVAGIAMRETPGFIVLAPALALYTVATTSTRRVSRQVGAATVLGTLLAVYLNRPGGPVWLTYMFAVVATAACWLVGDNVRTRRAYVSELEAKAARAEEDRESALARAAAQERERIARELHDVVAHHVSVIAVQAGAARLLAEEGDANRSSAKDWAAVEETARQALGELRQLLGVLRHDGYAPSLSPQPGLGQLDRLLDEVRGAGLPVSAGLEGAPVALPSALDLSAYRIIQEALTNVMKHEGCVPTTVVVRYGPAVVEVEVTNVGQPGAQRAASAEGQGHGLIGMRERVGVLGGRLKAGPRPEGGFVVRAQLPLDGAG